MSRLQLLIRPHNDDAKQFYKETVEKVNSSEDSGVDLYCVRDQVIKAGSISNKIKLGISAQMTTDETIDDFDYKRVGYMLVVRSSTGSKTPLRHCNPPGIIDKGYTGELMGLVDNVSDKDYHIKKGDRLFQIVHGSLEPINIVITDELVKTERGDGGFGSTGK